ncbi:MAG: hypothetical protein SGCHY_003781 [Lobulomycetales sp.]
MRGALQLKLLVSVILVVKAVAAYSLSDASCSGLAPVDARQLRALDFLFGRTPLDAFPALSPCNVACIRQADINFYPPRTAAVVRSIRLHPAANTSTAKDCNCRVVPRLKFSKNDSVAVFAGVSDLFNTTLIPGRGLEISLSLPASGARCSLVYPSLPPPLPPQLPPAPPVASSFGTWDAKTSTITALSPPLPSPCPSDTSTCILTTLSLELSPGLWQIHAHATMHADTGVQVCLYDASALSIVPNSCGAVQWLCERCSPGTDAVYRVASGVVLLQVAARRDGVAGEWGFDGDGGLLVDQAVRVSATRIQMPDS